MRTIEYANAFKKDYKRLKITPRHTQDMERLLNDVLRQLLDDSDWVYLVTSLSILQKRSPAIMPFP